MKRILLSVGISFLLTALGQWCLTHETLRNFDFSTILGLPGFEFAVILLGIKGLSSHPSQAALAEIISNLLLYFTTGYATCYLLSKVKKQWPSAEFERRMYDHR
jgi:hypothetical protein